MSDVQQMADDWVAKEYPPRQRPKYGDLDFGESSMVAAFVAGYEAAQIAAPGKWEYQSADGSWKPCRNAHDAATWAADGRKIRDAA